MGKLSAKFKRKVKLLHFRGNARNVNLIGSKPLDVITSNAKYAIINFAINVGVKIVELLNAKNDWLFCSLDLFYLILVELSQSSLV